jgi:hypothetical protein
MTDGNLPILTPSGRRKESGSLPERRQQKAPLIFPERAQQPRLETTVGEDAGRLAALREPCGPRRSGPPPRARNPARCFMFSRLPVNGSEIQVVKKKPGMFTLSVLRFPRERHRAIRGRIIRPTREFVRFSCDPTRSPW